MNKKATMKKKQQRVLEDSFSSDEDDKQINSGIGAMKINFNEMDPGMFKNLNLGGEDSVMQSFSKIDFTAISKYQIFLSN